MASQRITKPSRWGVLFAKEPVSESQGVSFSVVNTLGFRSPTHCPMTKCLTPNSPIACSASLQASRSSSYAYPLNHNGPFSPYNSASCRVVPEGNRPPGPPAALRSSALRRSEWPRALMNETPCEAYEGVMPPCTKEALGGV